MEKELEDLKERVGILEEKVNSKIDEKIKDPEKKENSHLREFIFFVIFSALGIYTFNKLYDKGILR